MRCCGSPSAPTASLFQSSDLPTSSLSACSTAARSAPLKSHHPSTQAPDETEPPQISSASPMLEFPRTALRTAGEGAERGEAGEGIFAAPGLRDPVTLLDLDGAVVDGGQHAGGIAGDNDIEHGRSGALGEAGL